jgi:hypothetical protein
MVEAILSQSGHVAATVAFHVVVEAQQTLSGARPITGHRKPDLARIEGPRAEDHQYVQTWPVEGSWAMDQQGVSP